MKNIAIISCLLFSQFLIAQIPSGSVAPNFISTDIDGNEWELYEVLNQGKTVILDISATWCSPCWDYHESGVLEELYEQYGPDGTDEMEIFLIEGDESTTMEDLLGTGNSTLGNWVEGTDYPIIDDRDIAEAFQINFFPTLFMICPNRKVYEIGQWTAEQIHNETNVCPEATGTHNASVLLYEGFEGQICENVEFAPSILMQNMGDEPLTSATLNLTIDNVLTETIEWSGDLNTYNVDEIIFDQILVTDDTDIFIDIQNPNGEVDENPFDNVYLAEINVAPFTDSEFVKLRLQLDNTPGSIYWELANSDGTILYYDGNRNVKYSFASDDDRYLTAFELIELDLPLPADGCYEFRIYDSFGDGLTGNGFYQIEDADGNILVSESNFNFEEIQPFGLQGSEGSSDLATIVGMSALPEDFCYELVFSPVVSIQNNGNNPITEIAFEVRGIFGAYLNHTWTGDISSLASQIITLPEIVVPVTDEIIVEILSVNGQPNNLEFKNTISRTSSKQLIDKFDWIIEMYTGTNAHEIYWQIKDELDNILISGGNETVGMEGGGMGIAMPTDPGAYANNTQEIQNITIPSSGCYFIQIFDDGGNGFSGGGFGSPTPLFKIRNNQIGIILNVEGNYGESSTANIEVNFPWGTDDFTINQPNLELHPNPVSDILEFSINNLDEQSVPFSISNAVSGKTILTQELNVFDKKVKHQISVNDLVSGVYVISFFTEKGIVSERFVKI